MNKEAACIWLGLAGKDIKAALLLIEEEGLEEIALFHAQQAVEKAIKSLIAYYGVIVPKKHNIAYLLSYCDEMGIDVSKIRPLNPERLTKYSVLGRYPISETQIGENPKDLIEMAVKVLRHVEEITGCEGVTR